MLKHLATTGIFLAALCSSAFAQSPCHVENDGPDFNDAVSMGGPNLLLGIRFVSPASFTCTGIEVFTGEGSGSNSLAIWSHDAGANEPDTQSGVGSWPMSAANDWQGASLGTPVTLTAGQTYWMVWGCQNGAQASVDVPMTTLGQVYRGSTDGGGTWSGPFQFLDRHWKFRLLGSCGGVGTPVCFGDGSATPCPCGNVDLAGDAGCANSTGAGCVLSASGSTSVAADDLELEATNALPNQPGVFFQGDQLLGGGAGVVFGDGLRCVGQNVIRLEVRVPDASGDAATTLDLAALGGVSSGDTKHYQYWYRDPNGSPCGAGFNLSNALSITWTP